MERNLGESAEEVRAYMVEKGNYFRDAFQLPADSPVGEVVRYGYESQYFKPVWREEENDEFCALAVYVHTFNSLGDPDWVVEKQELLLFQTALLGLHYPIPDFRIDWGSD